MLSTFWTQVNKDPYLTLFCRSKWKTCIIRVRKNFYTVEQLFNLSRKLQPWLQYRIIWVRFLNIHQRNFKYNYNLLNCQPVSFWCTTNIVLYLFQPMFRTVGLTRRRINTRTYKTFLSFCIYNELLKLSRNGTLIMTLWLLFLFFYYHSMIIYFINFKVPCLFEWWWFKT